MIICVCNNITDKQVQELKKEFPKTYIAILARYSKCGSCIKYLKRSVIVYELS